MIVSKKSSWFDKFNLFFMILLLVVIIAPFWYVFVISISTYSEYISNPYHIIPREVTFANYARALTQTGALLRSLGVSVFVTGVGVAISMVLSIIGGYALSKDELPGRDALFVFFIITMFFSGGLVPFYIVVRNLGLNNSIWSMILPSAMSTYNMILMKNYFTSIPVSLEEAARIDGYNDVQILFKVVLPISMPVIAAVSLFYGVTYWNSYFNAYLFISSSNLWPFQMYLRDLTIDNAAAARSGAHAGPQIQEAFKMAVVYIGIIPIVIVYPFLQKYFAAGVMLGAVKE